MKDQQEKITKTFLAYFPEFPQTPPTNETTSLKKIIKSMNLGRGANFKTPSSPPVFRCDSQGNVTFTGENTAQAINAIKEAIQRIHPFHRAPLVLLEICRVKYAEIHKLCGVATGSTISSLHYARRTLVPDIARWDTPSNDYLFDCGAIADGAFEVPDQETYQRILKEDPRLIPYMNFVKNLKTLLREKLTPDDITLQSNA